MGVKGLFTDWKNQGKFQKWEKKRAASPPTLYRVSSVQENNPWIRDRVRKSEKGSRRTTVTIDIYISYERQWQSQIRAQTGAPKVISGINGNILQLYQSNFILSAELIDNVNLLPWQV